MFQRAGHGTLCDLHGTGDALRCPAIPDTAQVVEHGKLRKRHPVRHRFFKSVAGELRNNADLVEKRENGSSFLLCVDQALLIRVSSGQRGAALIWGP